MQPDFADIRIVDLDTRRTTWSRVHESMRIVYLRLDRAPPDLEWVRLFHEERESRINPLRCGLWIEDDSISFDCLLRDVETGHLPDIQRSIDYANLRYRDVLARRDQQRRERQSDTASEAEALAALRARVQAGVVASSVAPSAPLPAAAAPRPADAVSPVLPAPPAPPAAADPIQEELERRRQALRAQYRAAATNPKETSRGNS